MTKQDFIKQKNSEVNKRCYQNKKQRILERLKERYLNDTEYREQRLQYSKEYYNKKKNASIQ